MAYHRDNSYTAVLVKEKPCPCCKLWKKSKAGEPHKHYGEKDPNRPFHCDVCNKSFRQEAHLKNHLRVHTNEKPFTCQTCAKRFANSDTLKKHLRIHSGEKPFSCPICGKSFRQKAHVERHMKSHNKDPMYQFQTGGNIQAGNHHIIPAGSKNDHCRNKRNNNHNQPPQQPQPVSGMHPHSQPPLQIPQLQRH